MDGGLTVSAPDSGMNNLCSSPAQGTALCSWARQFTLTVPLLAKFSTHVKSMGDGEFNARGNPVMD